MAWNGLGYWHVGLNNPAPAITACQNAIRSNPDDETLYFIPENDYVKRGHHKEAINAYRWVVKMKPVMDKQKANQLINRIYD